MDSDYGLLIYSNDLYNFYTNSIPEIDTFYLAIPKDNGNEFSLYVNMPDKELMYAERNTSLSYFMDTIEKMNQDKKVFLFPILPKELLLNSHNINDDVINKELEKILITLISNTFDKFIKNEISLEQSAYIITSNQYQANFLDWINLNSKFSNFIREHKLNYELVFEEFNDGGGNSLSGGIETASYEMSKPKVKVKKLPSKLGFSSISFIILILSLSTVLGILFAYYIYNL